MTFVKRVVLSLWQRGRLGMILHKKTSMQDIADRLSISKNTVSLALRNREGVSEKVRERVRRAAIEMAYAGYGRLRNRTDTTCFVVVVPEYVRSDTSFYYKVILGMEHDGTLKGIHIVIRSLTSEQDTKRKPPDLIDDLRVDGFITVGNISEAYVASLLQTQLPVVAVDNTYPSLSVDCVKTDDEGGGLKATNHLLAMGHRKIGFIGPVLAAQGYYGRWMGYRKALLTAGVEDCERFCLVDYARTMPNVSHLDLEPIDRFIARLSPLPSAFFCANDVVAQTLIKVFSQRGIKVPDEVSVVGFDNADNTMLLVPGLTTVNVFRTGMGQRVIETMMARIASPGMHTGVYCLSTSFVERESVKRIK
jgi:LacI family transcriptional regulator